MASTAASVVSQVSAANAQNKAIEAQTQQSYEQIAKQQGAEETDRARAARKEQARIKVAAGESGLQLGGSIEQLLMDSQMSTGLANERTSLNADNARASTGAEANRMFSQVQKPTLLGAGLQIGMAGLGGFASGTSLQLARAGASASAAANAAGGAAKAASAYHGPF
jgi:hypothetical protein